MTKIQPDMITITPTATPGTGEFKSISGANGGALSLPAGRSWAWFGFYRDSVAGTLSGANGGVSSGGTQIFPAMGGNAQPFAMVWNVNGTIPPTFYGYDVIMGINDNPAAAPYGGVARYVNSTTGVNSGEGTIGAPWLTLAYALNNCDAGDSIYLRGGNYTWTYEATAVEGTEANPIEVRSYPGESAIFVGESGHNLLSFPSTNWMIVRNLEIKDSFGIGLLVSGTHDSIFENLLIHENQGSGVRNETSDRNTYRYITSRLNYNAASPGNCDGISIASGADNLVEYCIAEQNSDDGFDGWESTGTVWRYNVAYKNGFDPLNNPVGDGDGFKMSNVGAQTYHFCIAFENRRRGFDAGNFANILYNCVAYNNPTVNYAMGTSSSILTNCISAGTGVAGDVVTNCTITTCEGTSLGGSAITSADFESVDFANINATAEGSRFFYPVDAALIDTGTDVGLGFYGSAPEIGAREI